MSAPAAPPGTYHERQQFMRCGLHAVNNMLQRRAYSTRDFEKIAADLAAFGPESSVAHLGNPHRAVLTLGNYDANVVLVALSLAGFEAAWCVHASVDTLRDAVRRPDTLGFLVNVSKFFSRHWLAVRKLTDDGSWGFFDSNAPHPRLFGSEDEVCSFAHLLSPFFFFCLHNSLWTCVDNTASCHPEQVLCGRQRCTAPACVRPRQRGQDCCRVCPVLLWGAAKGAQARSVKKKKKKAKAKKKRMG